MATVVSVTPKFIFTMWCFVYFICSASY